MADRQPDWTALPEPLRRRLLDRLERRAGPPSRSDAIPRRPRADSAPLSFAQLRLWFLEQLMPGTAAYNVPWCLRLTGSLDGHAVEQSVNEVVRRHESLRTTFALGDDGPIQRIAPDLHVALERADLGSLPEDLRLTTALERATDLARRPFDLQRGPLMRAALYRLSDTEHVLLLVAHHSVTDDWSIEVLMRELEALYDGFASGRPAALADPPVQYGDYATWQREWLSGAVLDTLSAMAREHMGSDLPVLELPTDRPRPPIPTGRGATRRRQLPAPIAAAVAALGRREGVTPFAIFLAAFDVLLMRYTGQEDLVVGVPFAGRTRPELEHAVGFFVNTLAIRTDLSGDPSFREAIARVRAASLAAYAYQALPFEKLVEAIRPERHLSHTPVFQVMCSLQHPLRLPTLPGLQVEVLDLDTGTSKFDLSMFVEERTDHTTIALEFSADLFDATGIDRMLAHYETMLAAAVGASEARIATLPVLSEPERRQLLSDWNATTLAYPNVGIHELVEAQAARTPDAVAVASERQELTYDALNRRANRIAHRLRSLGVRPDTLVGICVQRGLDMVVGLLGILKSGGAYLPLDPAYPRERLAFMLEDGRAAVLLTQEALVEQFPQYTGTVLCLDRDWPTLMGEPDVDPARTAEASHLAYVLYTSGSTGRPKGVALEHRNAVNFLTWALATFDRESLQGVLAATSICFDLSVFEIFAPLCCGGTVIVADHALHLLTLTPAGAVTLINTVPSAMIELLRAGAVPPSVRTVNLAGESLPGSLVQQIHERTKVARVFNLYGPTETTTYSTYTIVPPDATGNPCIGRPIANTQIYILDRHRQPVPIGVPGELCIGGDGVSRGYIGRPDLTAERFLPDPFRSDPSARLYCTGDLARYLPDGTIDFLGRRDHQVKVRGFRIELGEIEAVLAGHPGVARAVAVAREVAGDTRLVAYVVPEGDPPPGRADLRTFLGRHLPDYMIPHYFVTVPALPSTPSGKVDRRALPAPDGDAPLDHDYVPPRTRREQAVASLWARLLGCAPVGAHDNFFEHGGHSLLAMRVIAGITQEFDVHLPLQTLFACPTVAEFAAAIDDALLAAAGSEELARLVSELAGPADA